MRKIVLMVAAVAGLMIVAPQFASAAASVNGAAIKAAADKISAVTPTYYYGYYRPYYYGYYRPYPYYGYGYYRPYRYYGYGYYRPYWRGYGYW